MKCPPVVVPLFVAVLLVGIASCSGTVDVSSSDKGGDPGNDGDPGGATSRLECKSAPSVSAGRWRRLTAKQYANTVRDLLGVTPDTAGFVTDSKTGPFNTNTLSPVQENDVGAYDSVAQAAAVKAVANLNGLLACDPKVMGEDKCATQFIKSFGARAYRRPLSADEEGEFATVYKEGKLESFPLGIQTVVEAMLSSPSFLYMVEAGAPSRTGPNKLTGYEVASRLSYLLTGTMPDAALFAQAAQGKLDTADGVRAYARQLVDSEKFVKVAEEFHVQLLGVDAVSDTAVSKDAKYGSFTPEMRAAMVDEPRKFVNYVMTKGSGSVQEMLDGQHVFPAGVLAKVYGSNLKVDGDGRAEVTDGTRKGVLTLAGVLAAHPKTPSRYTPVARGHMVRRDILCETVPPPTVMVDFSLPPGAEKMTAQDLLREHQANPTCKGCHELMDSIGFGFETYDSIGAYRVKDDGGHVIDSSGEIVNISKDGKFANAAGMAETLASSPEVRECMSQQWVRFALGRDPDSDDDCSMQGIKQVLTQGDGNIREAILSLVGSDVFRLTRGQ